MTKHHILEEIRRTAAANGGTPLGFKRFQRETGIRYADWFGKYWKGWGDALREAGFEPNTLQLRIADEVLLERFVDLTRELGRIPVKGDLRLKRRSDPAFPNDKVFERFGSKAQLLRRARDYCSARPDLHSVAELFSTDAAPDEPEPDPIKAVPAPVGYVYLLRFGRHYKVGRTNSLGRRQRELEIQLPERARTVHVIKTDDPVGIEAYWHNRFASKRGNGEWFDLDPEDVAAFKRRSFQ
jgi:hypothetical protein